MYVKHAICCKNNLFFTITLTSRRIRNLSHMI